jgi:hypothetical protein
MLSLVICVTGDAMRSTVEPTTIAVPADLHSEVYAWFDEQALILARQVLVATNSAPPYVQACFPQPSRVDAELVRRLSGFIR